MEKGPLEASASIPSPLARYLTGPERRQPACVWDWLPPFPSSILSQGLSWKLLYNLPLLLPPAAPLPVLPVSGVPIP